MAFELITQAPRPQKIVFGVLVFVILIAGGYFFLLSPKMVEVTGLRQRRASKQSELLQTQMLAQSLARFKQEALALRARLEKVKERLPTEKEIPTLYRQVSDMAHQTGLSVSLFQPQEPVTKDVYQEIPITVTAESSFHELGVFFDRLSRLARIVNLTGMKLTGISRSTGTLRADLTVATYVFRPVGAPPPPPPPGTRRTPAARAPGARR